MLKNFFFLPALLMLLSVLGGGATTPNSTDAAPAPRPIPWDCDTWAAFAHEERTIQILESLAANRGKALYCGVDQSDTFTKAETWQAGRDRNERDDTVYFGEEGQFRGFIAAQEGYLTDGETGVTGVSIDRIFEFPQEQETRRRVKVKTLEISSTESNRARSVEFGSGANDYGAIDNYQSNHMSSPFDSAPALTACRNAGYPYIRQFNPNSLNPGLNSSYYTPQVDGMYHAYLQANWTATCFKKVRGARR